ncbi:MAG: TolC family protein [Myxococcota bacterium]|nr:TolC family protein [Myxococcota bacterium]
MTRADLIDIFRAELVELMGEEFGLEVPGDAIVPSDYTAEGVRASLDALYDDPKIDLVVALGLIASQEAARHPYRPKPTFAPFPVDAAIQNLPYADGTSGVQNFNYLASNIDTRQSLAAFRELVSFEHLALFVNAELARAVPGFTAQAKAAAQLLGVELDVIPVDRSVGDALAAIGPRVDAVFVTPLLQLSAAEFEQLTRGFIERRLPSFSLLGEGEVAAGILAGIRPHSDWRRMARRISLNAQRALLGEDPGTLPVEFEMRKRLVLNMETARAIGFSPSWSVYVEARLLHPDDMQQRERTLIGSVREAISSNLSLEANRHEVLAGAEEVRNARSKLLPKAEFRTGYTRIDGDRARNSFGLMPESQQDVGGRVEQLIWDERAWASFTVEKHLQRSREEDRSVRTLDIVLAGASAYLDVLRARTLLRTERENLAVSRSNLDLARMRVAVGYSGRQEELRWLSRINRDKQAVIDAYVRVEIARQRLNQLLNRPIEESFAAQDATLAEYGFIFGDPKLLSYVDSPAENRVFRDFMVEVGLEASPEIKRIDAALEARERVLASTRSAFYSPSVAFRGDLRHSVHESGAGSNIALSDDTDYTLGLQLTFPIVRGGAKFSETRQAFEEVAQLRVERRLASQQVERDVRSTFFLAARSFTSIALSKAAAAAASENFALVTDLYARGAVGIIDLLDAQNAALRADQAAANAVHDFLVDLMRAERAASRFPFLSSRSERDALVERMKSFFARTP